MPRQQINTPIVQKVAPRDVDGRLEHHIVQDGESLLGAEYTPVVEIGWSRPASTHGSTEGSVVITMTAAEDEVLRAADDIRTRRESGHDHAAPADRMRHFSTHTITRADLNLLIRTARRARDAAFGTDE